jgi:hypothetical protein
MHSETLTSVVQIKQRPHGSNVGAMQMFAIGKNLEGQVGEALPVRAHKMQRPSNLLARHGFQARRQH